MTAEHPFWSVRDGRFVPAGELKAGDRLRLADGRPAEVTGLELRSAPAGQAFTTYNFEVAGVHTYFVAPKNSPPGTAGVWVHNAGSVESAELVLGWESAYKFRRQISVRPLGKYLFTVPPRMTRRSRAWPGGL